MDLWMSRTAFFLLTIITFVPSVAQNSISISPSPGEITTEGGLRTIIFVNPSGLVKVFLPEDIAAGDTISGTVTIEPIGKDNQERSNNQKVLNGYAIDLGNGVSTSVEKQTFIWTPRPGRPSTESKYITIRIVEILNENGKSPVSLASIPIAPKAKIPAPLRFKFPMLGQTGRPMVVTGPFDGNASNTKCAIGGTMLPVIAESPRQAICTSPWQVVGVTEIKMSEGRKETTGRYRNVGISLSAPKTNLIKGETATMTVTVSGLQGITNNIQIQMITTGGVNTQGGNTQMIQIMPSMVDPNGISIRTFTLNAIKSGNFNVTCNVQVFAKPKP